MDTWDVQELGSELPVLYRFGWAVFLCISLVITPSQAAPLPPPAAPQPVSETRLAQLLEKNQEETRKQIAALRPSILDKALPAIGAIIGALTASIVAFLLQRSRLKFDRESAFQKAGVEAISTLKNFRSRQLNEFYAPLQALLKQSLVLRDELYQRLQTAPPPNVVLEMKPDTQAASRHSLYIQHPGEQSKPFRLIDEMWLIQQQCPSLVPNVSAMVSVNEKVSSLLLNKIGLVRPESTQLSGVLGRFLAHQSVLEEVVRTAAQAGSKAAPLGYTTAYPRELNALVSADCQWLGDDLAEWERQATAWMTQIGQPTSNPSNGATSINVRPA